MDGKAWGPNYTPQPRVRIEHKHDDVVCEHLRWLAWWHGGEKQRRREFAETCPLAVWLKKYNTAWPESDVENRLPTRARVSEKKRRVSSENAKRTQAVRLRNRKRNQRKRDGGPSV